MQKFYIRFTRDWSTLIVIPCYSYDRYDVQNYAQFMMHQMFSSSDGEVEYEIYDGEPDWATQMLV